MQVHYFWMWFTILVVPALLLLLRWRAAKGENSGISMVFLVDQRQPFEEHRVRAAARKIFDRPLINLDDNPDEFVCQTQEGMVSREFLIHVPQGTFVLKEQSRPYFKKRTMEPPNPLQTAVSSHQGWFGLELVSPPADVNDRAQSYQWMCRFMAELADDSCLAFGCPELARFLPFSQEIKSKLASPQALRLLENVLPHPTTEPH